MGTRDMTFGASDLEQLRRLFLQEADEGLRAIEEALVTLEAQPDDRDALHEIFRVAHTIKGGAAMSDFPRVAEYAHRLEDALAVLRDAGVAVTPVRITLLLQCVDGLRELLTAESAGRVKQLRNADLALIARLIPAELVQAGAAADSATASADSQESSAYANHGSQARDQSRARSLRVDMAKLDAMLTLSGEIAVAKGRLLQLLEGAYHQGSGALAAAEELDRHLTALHERVTQMRLVPLGPVFRQHLRTVRDVAANQGKLVRLALDGEDVEVDASIVEQLRDPLTHMIRNAVDHGIEYPAARRDAGKDPCGTIVLHARHERGTVVIEVRDDGRGLNREAILATALARRFVTESESLSDAQVFALVMLPGFTTSPKVTEVSGRGVGMDVVRRNIESVRGTIELASSPGAGTTIRIRIPLTVAIIDGFVVGVQAERYVIPVDAVAECLTFTATQEQRASGVLNVRGTPLPYIRLRNLLGLGGSPPGRESVVVVHHEGKQAGLVVDQLHGETQAVLKPLSQLFRRVPGISGTTIMGDGKVSLILDVPHLIQHIASSEASQA